MTVWKDEHSRPKEEQVQRHWSETRRGTSERDMAGTEWAKGKGKVREEDPDHVELILRELRIYWVVLHWVVTWSDLCFKIIILNHDYHSKLLGGRTEAREQVSGLLLQLNKRSWWPDQDSCGRDDWRQDYFKDRAAPFCWQVGCRDWEEERSQRLF